MKEFWRKKNWSALARNDPATPSLAQGDYLPNCLVPKYSPEFGEKEKIWEVPVERANLVTVTQTCDLTNNKADHVALCPIFALARFEEINPSFQQKGRWEEVRKGRVEGLHLLASPIEPDDNRQSLVVDFKFIVSLPFDYLFTHAELIGDRWRLDSPYLEHFSQAFARFFMRVGLPSAIIPFK